MNSEDTGQPQQYLLGVLFGAKVFVDNCSTTAFTPQASVEAVDLLLSFSWLSLIHRKIFMGQEESYTSLSNAHNDACYSGLFSFDSGE